MTERLPTIWCTDDNSGVMHYFIRRYDHTVRRFITRPIGRFAAWDMIEKRDAVYVNATERPGPRVNKN